MIVSWSLTRAGVSQPSSLFLFGFWIKYNCGCAGGQLLLRNVNIKQQHKQITFPPESLTTPLNKLFLGDCRYEHLAHTTPTKLEPIAKLGKIQKRPEL